MSQISPNELLAQLKSFANNPPPSLAENSELRLQLYHATQETMLSFESAPDPINRVAVAQQAEWVMMRTSSEMGLFPALAGGKPKTAAELAEVVHVDPTLLLCFLRAGVSFGAVKEVGIDRYTLSSSYASLANLSYGTAYSLDFVHATFHATPGLLAANDYLNPSDPLNTAIQRAFNAAGKTPYQILSSIPEDAKAVGVMLRAMGIQISQRIENIYPFYERLIDGFEADTQEVIFVDVGAGHGHMVGGLREAIPKLPGRLVAQDLPYMISTAPEADGFEWQAYDFFTEQPIKHARAYYIQFCLHNWQDEECAQILTHMRDAMKSDYSRLIIHELVVPERGAHIWASVSDINQMGACASYGRTEKQWTALVASAGLGLPKFYHPTDLSSLTAIECVRNG